ncbi:FadR/GntR family transcriptional regulator [uncultured Draconibacterium sp.]|uniref:FadR/GntR family transcriptional regulator n=1 Tax=uncultured Draconibacterium sp. TaxID=1573823 RepID=UPI0029C06AD5|nr:FadR/GntR family transcriptional regulator [uncultured Draconibacterium sp.]
MDEVFRKIGSKLTLSQKIERRLEAAIREKKLPVGSKLPTERELCESFGVSRTALREALRRLSARGLIEITKGSGMTVTGLQIDDAIKNLNLYYDMQFDHNLIAQIIEVRRLFEPEIASLAAKQRTQNDLSDIQENIEAFKICNPDNIQMEADLDNKFHLLIAKATHNPIVQISMEPIYSLLPRMRNLIYANVEGEKDITLEYHLKIFDVINKQKGDEAAELMKVHLHRTMEIYQKYLHNSY